MLVREISTDARTGETSERWVEMPDVMTEEEAAGRPLRQDILAQLLENDVKVLRALTEGDMARIQAHNEAQAALRAQLSNAL